MEKRGPSPAWAAVVHCRPPIERPNASHFLEGLSLNYAKDKPWLLLLPRGVVRKGILHRALQPRSKNE